ncbi:MAG: class I SAM-dependent methyltransferase [Deltaproteobacteria bacterium]|jgi:ubiquinone/menaquinone biosynthesis C-methylase UbiE|nr:class I SAM-dependent methyltransferase [Deltaproteobacteria bacterium]
MKQTDETARYLKSCRSEFWRKVFAAELGYLLQHLNPGDEVLSVGCGPAHIESALTAHGFMVVGLDVSREALACAPDSVRAVAASAEDMPFPDASFDVVLYIASLQFIENYRTALERTARVLKPGGILIAMLLNPASEFFKTRYASGDSYVRKLRHTDLQELEQAAAEWFDTQGEYFMGIDGEELFDSADSATAALYVIKGVKRA